MRRDECNRVEAGFVHTHRTTSERVVIELVHRVLGE